MSDEVENNPLKPDAVHAAPEVPSQRVSAAKPSGPLPVHHVGIAVQSIDEAMQFYGGRMGLAVVDRRELTDRFLKVAFVQAGNTLLELLEATDPEGTVAKFIERRGPGLHHICFGTPDVNAHLRDLQDKGVELLDQEGRQGAHGLVAFLPPSAAHGVLVELLQPFPSAIEQH